MKVVRCCAAIAVTLVSSGIADAQLPGLPYSPSQSGLGFFVGAYGTGATLHPFRGGFCGVHYDFRYGFLWTWFLSPVGPNNATPTGYSAGLSTACQPVYPPLPPLPPTPPPPGPPVIAPAALEPHVTPEPSTWVLLGTGLVAILGFAALKSSRV